MISISLVFFLDAPIFTAFLVTLAVSTFAHVIHMGEMAPSEWDNPEKSEIRWNACRIELVFKVVLTIGLLWAIGEYP